MDEIWLFAYGSLLYKVDFPVLDSQAASIVGWQRCLWQGSHDHRGTPDAPGRVATLQAAPGKVCQGLAFRVSAEVFEHLDYREKNGYLRITTNITLNDSDKVIANGIVYLADENNAAWLGPASDSELARHIANSRGPSGENSDYVYQLAAALRTLGIEDEHVFNIERELLRLNEA